MVVSGVGVGAHGPVLPFFLCWILGAARSAGSLQGGRVPEAVRAAFGLDQSVRVVATCRTPAEAVGGDAVNVATYAVRTPIEGVDETARPPPLLRAPELLHGFADNNYLY